MASSETPPAGAAKRPYVAPTLVVHGDVQTLTQGNTGTIDDGDNGSLIEKADG